MKKINLLSFCILIMGSIYAQNIALERLQSIKKNNVSEERTNHTRSTENAIWSDDFSDANKWTINNLATSNLDWQIGTNFSNSANPFKTINSSSKSNGFAFLDSYQYTIDNSNETQSAWLTTANPINLSSKGELVLQFETYHFNFASKCFVVISDNNTDWPDLNPDFDASTNDNVYELFEELEIFEGTRKDPTLVKLNISKSAGNKEKVWVRFHWTGKAYAWLIDDVAIVERPGDDLVLKHGNFTGDGLEYGRIPSSQISDSLLLRGLIHNFGVKDQNNIKMNMEILDGNDNAIISTSVSTDEMKQDSSYIMSSVVEDFTPLELGNYRLNYVVSSDGDNLDGNYFTDNTYKRNFEVTKDLYSLDGIGIYETAYMKAYGTSDFENNSDGFILMTRYTLTKPTEISGLEIVLTERSKVRGQLFPFIISLDAVNNDDMNNRLVDSDDGVTLSRSDIVNGKVFAALPKTTLQPGIYFACVELFSNNNQNDVYIQDDITIPQVSDASMIYLPNNSEFTNKGLYSDGNAFAIRLGLNEYYVEIEETTTSVKNFSVYPNPSAGMFTVTSAKMDAYKIEVINVLGEVVSTRNGNGLVNESFDLSNYSSGLYFVKVSNGHSENVQKIIVK
jgi:hypothetical protein